MEWANLGQSQSADCLTSLSQSFLGLCDCNSIVSLGRGGMCKTLPPIALLGNTSHSRNRPHLDAVSKESVFTWVSYHALNNRLSFTLPGSPLHSPYLVIHSSRCDSIHSSAHTLVPHLTHLTFPQYPQIEQNTLTGYLTSSSPHAPLAWL